MILGLEQGPLKQAPCVSAGRNCISKAVILDARAMAHTGDPEVEYARLVQAGEHAEAVRDQSDEQNPPCLED